MRLFAARAYQHVSIEDIAREAGVSKGLLYHYFGGKEAFFLACLEEAAREMLSKTILDENIPMERRFRTGVGLYLDFVERRGYLARELLRGEFSAHERVREIVGSVSRSYLSTMVERLGVETVTPALRAAIVGWCASIGALCLEWDRSEDLSREVVVELAMQSLMGLMRAAVGQGMGDNTLKSDWDGWLSEQS